MNCRFCQQEIPYMPLFIESHKFDVHFCATCSAEYVDFKGYRSVHLYALLGQKMYRWSVDERGDQILSGRIWYVEEPGEPGVRPNRKTQLLKNFSSGFPTITPENIERKLRFMLLFL